MSLGVTLLYINLPRARQRRLNLLRQIERALPTADVHRIEAVDGPAMAQNADVVSPYARFILAQRHKTSNHAQMETWGAVGCALSHLRCWEWLLATDPIVAGLADVLVLEDDACLEGPTFAAAWAGPVRALRAPPVRAWDVLFLGFFGVEGRVPAVVHGQTVYTLEPGGTLYGTHAYLVTRRGAAILRQYALPLEVQVDAYIVTLMQLGVLRGYMVAPVEVVTQCVGDVEGAIGHHFVSPVLPTAPPPLRCPPSADDDGCCARTRRLVWCILLVGTLFAVALGVTLQRERTKQ